MQMINLAKAVLCLGAILPMWLVTSPANGVTLTTLVSFNGTNGASPSAGLVPGTDGNFYGTTAAGGTTGFGTVFRVDPSGTLTNLVSFNQTNGAGPRARLVQAQDGNFYGTTYYGGTNNIGTAFKLTTNGVLTTLVTFADTNGAFPIGGVMLASDGNLYGTTVIGGSNSSGTAFQLRTNGTFATFFSFDSRGYSPYSSPVQATDGSLYGTTFQGGTNGYGAIFRLMTNGAFTPLYSFSSTNEGANPYAPLVQGTDGWLYGTTFYGGLSHYGTAFRLTTNGVLATLVSFGNTNGAFPQAGMVQGADGSFYGTTSYGGAYTNQSGDGYGTVFRLATNGTLTTLVSFNGTNGANPQGTLVQDSEGSFYGTTASGGANGNGTIFRLRITPPPVFQLVSQTGNVLTITWSAATGQIYQVQYKTNLNQLNWSNLGSSVTATNVIAKALDTIGPDPHRFYRVVLLP